MSNLGRPFSVRLPEGCAEEIRALSGRPPSELLRMLAEAWLKRARAEHATPQPDPLEAGINQVAGEQA